MTSGEDLQQNGPQTWIDRVVRAIAGPDRDPSVKLRRDPEYIVPSDQRKVAMKGLDELEVKWSVLGFIVAVVMPIAVAIYVASQHRTTKVDKANVTVLPDALLFGGAVLVICIFGLVALRLRKRTMVAFALMLSGLGLANDLLLPVGLGLVVLGGWLMLRAFRINRYGTANSKAAARRAADRPRGRSASPSSSRTAGSASKSSGKTSTAARAPTANKRYTPKSAPRKKIPKPTE